MPNSQGVEDSNRWYRVNGDTWTYRESRSPNQICQPNPQLDFHRNQHDAWEAELSERFRLQNYPVFKELSTDARGIQETYELVMRCHGWLLKATEPGMAGFPFREATRLQLRKLFSDEHFITTDFQRRVEDYYLMIQDGQWLKLLNEFVVLDTTYDILDHSLQMHEVRKHWSDTFLGEGAEAFEVYLRDCRTLFQNNPETFYSKSFEIIQSSGTVSASGNHRNSFGRTSVNTASFVLRGGDDTGFPPGDPEILNFLTTGEGRGMANSHSRALCLLVGIVQTETNFMEVLQQWNLAFPLPHESVNAKRGNKFRRSSERQTFCKDIVSRAEQLMQMMEGSDYTSWDWRDGFVGRVPTQGAPAFERFRGLLKEPFLALEKLLPEPASGHPKFLIVFDEIATVYSRDNLKDIHAALRRILRSLRHFDIWTVFLSTSCRIRLFSPADGEDASAWVFKGELAPIAPFFALPVSAAARQSLKIKGNAERLKPMTLITPACGRAG
ncbi:hypothetical protein BDD12DRAFT_900809 [Trichophaea hybrida]|nr:hypothetical protein BDD12DRAFT_900809 [Trichophaea hybrida]